KQNFDKDGYMQDALQAELRYALSNHLNVKVFGNFSTYHNDLDEGAFTDDKDFTAKNRNNLGSIHFNYHKTGFSWNVQASYQQAKRTFVDDSSDVSSPYYKYATGKYIGNSLTAETFGNMQLAKHIQLVSGFQYIRQTTDQYYMSTGDYGD